MRHRLAVGRKQHRHAVSRRGRDVFAHPIVPVCRRGRIVGQKEVALDAIFLEADTPIIDIAGLIWTPVYQPLRSEPRFLEFLRVAKMPAYWREAGWSEFCGPKRDNDFECTK